MITHCLYIDFKFPWKLARLCGHCCSHLLPKSKLLIDIYILIPCLSFNSRPQIKIKKLYHKKNKKKQASQAKNPVTNQNILHVQLLGTVFKLVQRAFHHGSLHS